MSNLSETEIQHSILKFLELIKVTAYRNNTGSRGGVRYGLCKGSADIIGIFHGRFLAIEVKKPKEHPTPEQREFLNLVNEKGGVAFYACSVKEVRIKLSEAERMSRGLNG